LAAIVTVEVTGWDATDLSKLLRTKGINTSASLRAYAVIDMDENERRPRCGSLPTITTPKRNRPVRWRLCER